MKYRFFLSLFGLLLSFSAAKAQFLSDTIFFDNFQQIIKTPDSSGFYRVVTIDTLNNFQFKVNDYYSNGLIKMSGTYRSLNPDNRNGHFTYYFQNGQIQKQCTYRNNKLDGKLILWYESGTIKQECYYSQDKLTGVFKTYSTEGVVTKIAEYNNGKKNGKFLTYYENGKPLRQEKYKEDVLLKGKCFAASGKDTTYFIYFTPPSFLGGDISNFTSWVMEKLQYPAEAENNNEEGEVKVKFTIDELGTIKEIKITKPDRHYFNSEVLRVIANSPIWKPAKRDISAVEVSIEIPVKFSLPEKSK